MGAALVCAESLSCKLTGVDHLRSIPNIDLREAIPNVISRRSNVITVRLKSLLANVKGPRNTLKAAWDYMENLAKTIRTPEELQGTYMTVKSKLSEFKWLTPFDGRADLRRSS